MILYLEKFSEHLFPGPPRPSEPRLASKQRPPGPSPWHLEKVVHRKKFARENSPPRPSDLAWPSKLRVPEGVPGYLAIFASARPNTARSYTTLLHLCTARSCIPNAENSPFLEVKECSQRREIWHRISRRQYLSKSDVIVTLRKLGHGDLITLNLCAGSNSLIIMSRVLNKHSYSRALS